ncbi:hypothetical protein E1B28_008429 [Marasmius oreades]|uniref:Uncharacterized protein n=1 Tax=Marasmius oreades TaxID=181124 RepID=A0A9P7RYZ0_9AGAR|nr:uncharacterized protein E1B28_008429 [Marasmius oreades]KAG7092048.1 hypothetical protein E1B28_008429 [Marasmius oreades]
MQIIPKLNVSLSSTVEYLISEKPSVFQNHARVSMVSCLKGEGFDILKGMYFLLMMLAVARLAIKFNHLESEPYRFQPINGAKTYPYTK